MKFTLRTKFIILTTFIVTFTMADVTYFLTIRGLQDKRAAVELQMKRIAQNIATMKLLDRQNWSDYQNYISQLMAFNDDIIYIAIYDERNWLRAHTLNTDLVEIDKTPPLSKRRRAEIVRRLDAGLITEESQKDLRTQTVNIQSGDRVLGSVHVGFSLIKINNEVQNRIIRNIGMAILFIVLYNILVIFLSRRLTQPLERLSRAMAAIAQGRLQQQVKVESRDEIGQLAQTFNQMALENAVLYDKLREQERIKRELEIAREVQHKLLPDEMPAFSGFQFDGVCLSAQEVGGDYFDFFRLSKAQLGIVIADVSGKGTSASFYMAEIKGMMSSLVSMYNSPKKVLTELNKRLYSSLDRKMFATMIYGVLNVKTRQFTFVRAGHNSLLHITAQDQCKLFTPRGIGLGLDSGQIFDQSLEESVLAMNKGETLLLFTDGITESMNKNREEFGEERLLDTIRRNGTINAISLREKIYREVESFVEGAQQHDDLTMVVVHCNG
ncbi:MAG: PP2C family protein-serine/threonine phosphatase [bacterium]